MKKLVQKCLLFGMMICLCLLFKVEADAEELKKVTSVELQLPTDAGGFTYEEFKSSMTILSEGVAFPTTEQAPNGWFGIYEEEKNAWAHSIEAGKTYRMEIYLSPKEGYKFEPNSILQSCLLNGRGQGFSDWGGGTGSHQIDYSVSEEFIYISVKNYKIDEWIESAEFFASDYRIGVETNLDMVTTTTEHIKVEIGTILDGDFGSLGAEIKPDTEYVAVIMFKPDIGYTVSKLKKQNIKVMGKEPKNFEVLENGYYFVECDLDILHEGGVANCHSPKNCSGCGEPYGEVDLTNHDGETELRNVLQATCKQQGYSGDTYCLSCGEMISAGTQTPISAQHCYDEGVITTSPTETDAGVKTYTCSICQTTKTEMIPRAENSNGTQEDGSQNDETKDDGDVSTTDDSNKGDSKQENSDNSLVPPAINSILTDSKTGMQYRVSKAGESGGSVEFFAPANKKIKQITIPTTVKIGGISYKVNSIAKNAFKGCKSLKKVVIGKNITKIGSKAFYGCKNLKTITIKTTKLKSSKVGKKAFTGTSKKAKVTVPKKSYKTYKKFLYKKGIYKKAKIKKAKK